MRAIKNFFVLIWRCLTSVGVYRELLSKSVGQGAFYLLLLLSLITLRLGVSLLGIIPKLNKDLVSFAQELATEVPKFYPPELEIVVENGEVRTNVPQPYYIPVPAVLRRLLDHEAGNGDTRMSTFKHFIEIDTNAGNEDYLNREALILVTKRSVVGPDKKKGFEVKAIPSDESFVLNRAVYDSYVPQALFYIEKAPWFASLGLPVVLLCLWLIVPALWVGWMLLYLLFTSLLALVISIVLGGKLSYGRIYVLSLYGLTFPVVIEEIMKLVIPIPMFLFTALFLGWMSVVLAALARDSGSRTT